MTVVPLKTARRHLRPVLRNGGSGWQPDETAELMRFYAVWSWRHGAAGHACGETEGREPQFYVLGPDPARPCLACVSRLWRDGHPWYVVEDGSGGLRSEGCDLGLLVGRERSSYRPLLSAPLLLAVPAVCRLLADIDCTGAGVDVALASQPNMISPEGILWWTSQLLALA